MRVDVRMMPVLLALTAFDTGAQTTGTDYPPPVEQATPRSQEHPEYRFRPLPEDTFKPSEEIAEDFPVPFPVDI